MAKEKSALPDVRILQLLLPCGTSMKRPAVSIEMEEFCSGSSSSLVLHCHLGLQLAGGVLGRPNSTSETWWPTSHESSNREISMDSVSLLVRIPHPWYTRSTVHTIFGE